MVASLAAVFDFGNDLNAQQKETSSTKDERKRRKSAAVHLAAPSFAL